MRHISAVLPETYTRPHCPTTKPDISIQDVALRLLSSPCGLMLSADNSGSGCTVKSFQSSLVKETTLALNIFPGDKLILTKGARGS